jgi:hypothetical protein
MRSIAFFVFFVAIFISPSALLGEEIPDFHGPDRKGKTVFGGAIGFTLGPDTFLIAPDLDFFINNEITLGPGIQFGVSERTILVIASGNFKYYFDIPEEGFLKRFKPCIQTGLGFALYNVEIPTVGSDTETGAVLNLGLGFDIFITDSFALGNHLIFNIMLPMIDERLIFSWHFLKASYLF